MNTLPLRRTKIVATIGPSSADQTTIRALLEAGIDVARINTSHADCEAIKTTIRALRAVAETEGRNLGILLDLSGPKIRVDNVPEAGFKLAKGEEYTLGQGRGVDIEIRPDIKFDDIATNARVMLDDGTIALEVTGQISPTKLKVRVTNGGLLKPNKGVNFPGVALKVPSFTKTDDEKLRAGIEAGVDWVAMSFVRHPDDREAVDAIFDELGVNLPLMAKIEKPEAVDYLPEIIDRFDGIMVARGDLGVEMALEEVPIIQKRIIRLSNAAGKPVITATQLLDSMVTAPTPTRAEVNDVANAIFDGTDAVMLSNETAVGLYPVEAVETLKKIAIATDQATARRQIQGARLDYQMELGSAIAHAACQIATECAASIIVTMTHSGVTALGVSRYRPNCGIVALSPVQATVNRLQLSWGVIPILVGTWESTQAMSDHAGKILLEAGYLNEGDYFVLTAGVPIGQAGTTNLLKVAQV